MLHLSETCYIFVSMNGNNHLVDRTRHGYISWVDTYEEKTDIDVHHKFIPLDKLTKAIEHAQKLQVLSDTEPAGTPDDMGVIHGDLHEEGDSSQTFSKYDALVMEMLAVSSDDAQKEG